MKQFFFTLAKHFLFFFLFFFLGRIFFLFANQPAVSAAPWSEILLTFRHALRIDLSTICYLMVVPTLLISVRLCTDNRWITRLLNGYGALVIIVCSAIIFADIAVYGEWANKLNYKALQYLRNPSEVVRSATAFQTVLVLGGVTLYSAALIFVYCKWISRNHGKALKRFWVPAFFIFCMITGLLFIGMRGGISPIPISQSAAYFSKHQILNDAAVNPAWNVMQSTIKFSKSNSTNPFVVLESTRAEELVNALYVSEDSTEIPQVLKNEQVNVVIVVLESWSADLIESLGGESGITPNFAQLEKEGILFTQMYANGHRSQEGLSALLSGFPPIPVNVITDNFEKYKKLNSVVKDLKPKNYNSSFYFGGDLVYGNLKAYLMSNEFDRIEDECDMPRHLERGKLSIFDQYTMEYHLQQLDNEEEPFFSMLFTASTHSPYDEPKIVEQIVMDTPELQYLNAAKYTDFCLGEYFRAAKQESWYDNTLFILVADHSHNTHRMHNYHSPEYQRIPMLWLGGAVKEEWRGRQIAKLCSSVDVPLTLLHQLGVTEVRYDWSNDIFDPSTPEFVAFQTTTGIDWISRRGFWAYNGFSNSFDVRAPLPTLSDSVVTVEEERVRAFLQVLYEEYLRY